MELDPALKLALEALFMRAYVEISQMDGDDEVIESREAGRLLFRNGLISLYGEEKALSILNLFDGVNWK